MIFTEEDEQVHRATNTCFICQEHMPPNQKVRDHCHFTGKYRGAAYFKCNLAFKHSKSIPVFSTIWKDMILTYSRNILKSTKT